MSRRVKNLIGLDEFVEVQSWSTFDRDWPDLAPYLKGQSAETLRAIGQAHLTAASQPEISKEQENFALEHIIGLIDQIGIDAPRGRLGVAFGFGHNLPGGAGWRLHQQMGRVGADLAEQYRYDPDSYTPVQLRAMLEAAKTGSRGPARDRTLDLTIARLAGLWWDATGKKPTFSSLTKLDEHGPARSAFGRFVHAVFDCLDASKKDTEIATSVRRVVRATNRSDHGTNPANS